MFEFDFEAKAKVETLRGADGQYSIDLTFVRKKRDSSGKEDPKRAANGPETLDQMSFSKGKKVVYTLCFILALNTIQPVNL